MRTVAGAFALNFDPGQRATPAGVWRSLVREKGSLLMIGVALCWSITPAFDKLAVEASGVYTHGLLLNGGVGLGALAWLLARGRVATLKPRNAVGGVLVLAAVIGFVALVLLLTSYATVWVGIVETVRRVLAPGAQPPGALESASQGVGAARTRQRRRGDGSGDTGNGLSGLGGTASAETRLR